MSYGEMAYVYDQLMADVPYDKWVEWAHSALSSYAASSPMDVLDLGCGTGEITLRMNELHYRMTGVDLSEDMLALARQKARPDQQISWLHMDMLQLESDWKFNAVISFCDVLNYITTSEELKMVFRNVYHALEDSGLFLFDVHALSYVSRSLAGATFAEVYDELSYIWFCDPGDQPGEIVHDLTFFLLEDDTYRRFDETHVQRAYTMADLKRWLEDSGFVNVRVSCDFSHHPIEQESDACERLFFVCHKQS
ncbi:class I SAM-dependent methyltransferase [Thalassobacillus sp. CUG 92003]|uniref:class I SAM-dependent DNA methyltransferase n=1 Tax=Thalassobacillus sp. CUG 92003 TaxID=2736641 RepID=UPI0015E64E97|nr:class I SAM-dependent methyltransferase [Thalassobacillus sp. CUG 92003]